MCENNICQTCYKTPYCDIYEDILEEEGYSCLPTECSYYKKSEVKK